MKIEISPSRIIVLSFTGAILIGSLLLTLPWATVDGKGLSWVDAIFTATSATCVTGLIVVDTGSYLSHFGQLVVLLLIQAGGLGIMTLSTFFIVALGKKISLKGKLILQDALNFYNLDTIFELLKHIVLFTLSIEACGAVILFLDLKITNGYPLKTAIYYSLFHAISAFCNAGFSLYSDSLIRFVGDPVINLTVMGLIILGGLGFPVLYDLYRKIKSRKNAYHITFHTKVVLLVTATFIVIGALIIYFCEANNTFITLTLEQKILASLFQSITTRTAGFNTVSIESMREATWLFMMFLMFVGASPGGTGGGIKTTTFAVVAARTIAVVKNRSDATLLKKRISEKIIGKALSIFLLSLFFIFTASFVLSYIEPYPLSRIVFEVFSAFGTVGLSTGITPQLTSISKIILSIVMLTGRVGPLTMIVAMAESGVSPPLRYPEGEILVG